jgi:hypothetical protein
LVFVDESAEPVGPSKSTELQIGPGYPDRCLDDLNALSPEHLVETGRKFGVSVSD